jgi:PAS domain-containing protein
VDFGNDGRLHAGRHVGSRLALAVERELTSALARADAAEHEQRFRDIAEVSGAWIWESDTDYRFSFYSSHGHDRFPLPPQVGLGKTRWELAGADPDLTSAGNGTRRISTPTGHSGGSAIP